ncbi:MAG: aminotransferase class I/II-fold pyridoxal phosphate-dependent enzyme [Planctomycetota bacterium]|nr:aminotransferase class I/II-fold pyridoxal phosphate-dependent enzyme [Planctomycetota bacterium]
MGKLALFGGTPVRREPLPYGRQAISDEDIALVVETLRSDWLTGGPRVDGFERAFAEFVGAEHAVAVSSGTAALHAAVFAAGIGPGDEALSTPLTFSATTNVLLHVGATPVFSDVEGERLGLDPSLLEARINERTKALMPVDYAGHPADLEALGALAQAHGLVVIEDASHSLGARVGGRQVGSIADLTTFSFHPVKHLACGEGGMITTADPELAERMRRFRNHGLSSAARTRAGWSYDLVELGLNYRLTDIAAALGTSQIARLEANVARRREIAAAYDDAFAAQPELVRLVEHPDRPSSWHLYPLRLQLPGGQDEWIAALRTEGIGANVHYRAVNELTLYRQRGYDPAETPVAQAASHQLVSLPMFHAMTDQDVADSVAAVRKLVEHYLG